MEGLINLHLLQELENEVRRTELNLQRRHIRDHSNPFETPDEIFSIYYRLPKESVQFLIARMRPHFNTPQRPRITSIPVELKVLVMLYFCGHGSYQKCVGQNFKLAMGQSTISKVLAETTDIMNDHLMIEFIKFPILAEEENVIKQRFYTKYNFPGTIGAVDCTHVGIVSPPIEDPLRPGIVYLNRKGFYSLNIQMICDADLSILNCNSRFPGSVHDSAIWSLSSVRRIMEQKYLNDQASSWLIGDSGYPLVPWLLTPIENANIDTAEGRYTAAQIRARACIERCFGCLKQRFRCLLKHRILHYDPVRAAKIVNSCAVLHNISILTTAPEPDIYIENAPEPQEYPPININQGQRGILYREGMRRRNYVVNNYFA